MATGTLISGLIFIVCLLQALETGTFLTLDVTTKVLQQKWEFNLDQMVSIGTIGYSLGFLGVGLFNLFTHFPIWLNVLIAGLETSLCWFLIWFYLCPGCITWYWVMLLEAGIGMGTAIGYTAAVQITSRHSNRTAKQWRLVLLALSVAVGSIMAFCLFVEIASVSLVLIIMFGLSLTATGLLIISSLLPVTLDDSEEVMLISDIKPSTEQPILIPEIKIRVKFSVPFAFYLFAINLTFGVLMTFINSSSSILQTYGRRWSSQRILIFFVLGNFVGRLLSLWLKNYLARLLWLFALLSCLLGMLQAALLPFWNIGITIVILLLSSFFFGIIWATTTLLAREFFSIAEKQSLGLVFFGMAGGPILFGLLAAWLYSLHRTGAGCLEICFEVYFILASLASFLATGAYLASWYLIWIKNRPRSIF